jgi:hypothetical protein
MRDRKALKKEVLANARKKMGFSEDKRAEFKERIKESRAKRMGARQNQERNRKNTDAA